MGKPIKVIIHNNEYFVKSAEDTEFVSEIAEYVNKKIDEISRDIEGLSEKKTAILAALNIAGDYFQLLKDRDDLVADIRQRSEKMIYSIESLLS